MNIIEQIDLKFTSGNDVPVSRAVLTKEEWEEVKFHIRDIKTKIGGNGPIEILYEDEWYPHDGGPCPKEAYSREVYVKFRDGGINSVAQGHLLSWNHYMEGDDIIAYKIN